MAEKLDYKKAFKELYSPGKVPAIIEVPEMLFIAVDGRGDPNTSSEYQASIELLYGLSFGIKMSKMKKPPEGYFEYVVPPLEGLWRLESGEFNAAQLWDKSKFFWTSMIRQPEFVTMEVFECAQEALAKKRPALDVNKARLMTVREGLCAQLMHIGPYDDEPASIEKLHAFIEAGGYCEDFSVDRKHHEIYLGDPRKTAPERLRTVIRHPIALK